MQLPISNALQHSLLAKSYLAQADNQANVAPRLAHSRQCSYSLARPCNTHFRTPQSTLDKAWHIHKASCFLAALTGSC